MTDRQYFLRLMALIAIILSAGTSFLFRVQSSVDSTAPSRIKPKRTPEERQARLARACDPEITPNPPIEPNHTIIGRWNTQFGDFSGQTLQLYADGTFDLWQFTCVNPYDDYPIHGRYLFDGTEIRLGVEKRLSRKVWNHAWSFWRYEGESFLAPQQCLHNLDLNDPWTPSRLLYRDGEWDDAKLSAFREAFWNRYLETVPANACYPANVE